VICAYVFDRIAVLVIPARVTNRDPQETGARVEVRLRDVEPRRGSWGAAQRVVIDRPVFRGDLFDQGDQAPGNWGGAHFHPSFDDCEPTGRYFNDGLTVDPAGWLAAELSDLPRLLARSGLVDPDEPWVAADALALREAIPVILDAVRCTCSSLGIRLEPPSSGWRTRITNRASALRTRALSR
jgi:hypothetical protein